MRSMVTRWAIAAVVLGVLAAGRAEAALVLVAQAGPGVNLSNIHVGQTFEIDLLGEQGNPSDKTETGGGGGNFNAFSGNLQENGYTQGPNIYANLMTDPVIFKFSFTATAAGAASYQAFSGSFNTNQKAYTGLTSNDLEFTILPAAVATPEPATLLPLAAGALATGFYGWRRSRRRAA